MRVTIRRAPGEAPLARLLTVWAPDQGEAHDRTLIDLTARRRPRDWWPRPDQTLQACLEGSTATNLPRWPSRALSPSFRRSMHRNGRTALKPWKRPHIGMCGRGAKRERPSPCRRSSGVCRRGMAPSIKSSVGADDGRGPRRLGSRVAACSQPRTSGARRIPGRPACRPPAHIPTCRGRSQPARCRRRSGRRSCGGRIGGQPKSAAGGGQVLGRW